MDNEIINKLMNYAKNKEMFVIDLENNEIKLEERSKIFQFSLDSFKKECLMKGYDDIDLTLEKKDKIIEFETKNKELLPWLY